MNALDKWSNGGNSLTPERKLMIETLARIGAIEERRRGQAWLLFGIDLTASRAETLLLAQRSTAAMFDAVKAIGIAVKLIYYRGSRECRATGWNDDPAALSDCMKGLSTKAGTTQIARVLRFALDEKAPLSGVVFIGDCIEEKEAELLSLAAQLGKREIPLYIFHERPDCLGSVPDDDARIFERLAGLSGGQYCEFKPDSGAVLRELLSTIAAFSAAGIDGMKQVEPAATAEARQLQSRLLLAAPERGPATGKR